MTKWVVFGSLSAVAWVAAALATPAAPPRLAGERAYLKCYSCHALEPGKNDLDGPSLHGVVGRKVAAQPNFAYSPALRRFARSNPRWTPQLIDRFVRDPEALVPGTSMNFHGVPDPVERAALIAYLRAKSGRL